MEDRTNFKSWLVLVYIALTRAYNDYILTCTKDQEQDGVAPNEVRKAYAGFFGWKNTPPLSKFTEALVTMRNERTIPGHGVVINGKDKLLNQFSPIWLPMVDPKIKNISVSKNNRLL